MAAAKDAMKRHGVVWYGQIMPWSWGTLRHRSNAGKSRCRMHGSQMGTLPREESLVLDLLSVCKVVGVTSVKDEEEGKVLTF